MTFANLSRYSRFALLVFLANYHGGVNASERERAALQDDKDFFFPFLGIPLTASLVEYVAPEKGGIRGLAKKATKGGKEQKKKLHKKGGKGKNTKGGKGGKKDQATDNIENKLKKSHAPSTQPSQTPSVSVVPSSTPSNAPSVSMEPSIHPSKAPTASMAPSSHPSESPSVQPSKAPSKAPSQQPSGAPSGSPSQTPSMLISCPCNTENSFFRQFVTGVVTSAPGSNGFCNNSGSTALAVVFPPGAIAAGGEAINSGSGLWACEGSGGLPGDTGFITDILEEEARLCADLVRNALIASGVNPTDQCGPW